MKLLPRVLLFVVMFMFTLSTCSEKETFDQLILLETADGLTIKAEHYEAAKPDAPVILLFHQAGFSRGEYRSIAPRLKEMGFHCIAIDQRSGDKVKGVENDTYAQAVKLELGTDYIDAYPDLELLLNHARKTYPDQKIIVWGSSYSASLTFVLANQYPDLVSAVVGFSPGAYFAVDGKSINDYASVLNCPVFMTCSRDEVPSRREIFDKIPHEAKTFFAPEFEGFHGSRALWPEHDGNELYWEAVSKFLSEFTG